MSAGDVSGCIVPSRGTRSGPNPTPALHSLQVRPISILIAKQIIEPNHYLGTVPGGTKMTFGVFNANRLVGGLVLGAGPNNAHALVDEASADDCLTLSRLWVSDELPKNSESRIISIITRALRKDTSIKFLLSYADPSQGHLGIIYQASGWLYIGLSMAMELLDMGDGIGRHSRSVAQVLGTHSMKFLTKNGVQVKLVKQAPKHRYIRFLDSTWQSRLALPILPYPKKENNINGTN